MALAEDKLLRSFTYNKMVIISKRILLDCFDQQLVFTLRMMNAKNREGSILILPVCSGHAHPYPGYALYEWFNDQFHHLAVHNPIPVNNSIQ